MLAPIVGKDLKQKVFLEVVLRVLEGLINRGFVWFSVVWNLCVCFNYDGISKSAKLYDVVCDGTAWWGILVRLVPDHFWGEKSQNEG